MYDSRINLAKSIKPKYTIISKSYYSKSIYNIY